MIKLKFIFLLLSSNLLYGKFIQEKLEFIQELLIEAQKNNKKITDELKAKLIYCINDLILKVDPKEKRKAYIKDKINKAQIDTTRALKNKKIIQKPLVSFIIPCYNRQNTVKEAINSIYIQNMNFPFEVIAVDDASTDNTFTILKQYENKYDNFFVYKHEINKQAPATRNTAIAHSRGKYIFNLDSDDILVENLINPLVKIIEEKNYDIVCPKTAIFFKDFDTTNIENKYSDCEGILTLNEGIHTIFLPTAGICKLFKKTSWENVGGFMEQPGQDTWAFNFTLLANGNIYYVANEGTYFHRIWSSATNKWYTDYRNKQTDVNPLKSIMEYQEILTKDSNNCIKNYSMFGNSLLSSDNNLKVLKLINNDAIKHLFNAYKFEESKKYLDALNEYKKSIIFGCNHIKILLKCLRISIYCEQWNSTIELINQILKDM